MLLTLKPFHLIFLITMTSTTKQKLLSHIEEHLAKVLSQSCMEDELKYFFENNPDTFIDKDGEDILDFLDLRSFCWNIELDLNYREDN